MFQGDKLVFNYIRIYSNTEFVETDINEHKGIKAN